MQTVLQHMLLLCSCMVISGREVFFTYKSPFLFAGSQNDLLTSSIDLLESIAGNLNEITALLASPPQGQLELESEANVTATTSALMAADQGSDYKATTDDNQEIANLERIRDKIKNLAIKVSGLIVNSERGNLDICGSGEPVTLENLEHAKAVISCRVRAFQPDQVSHADIDSLETVLHLSRQLVQLAQRAPAPLARFNLDDWAGELNEVIDTKASSARLLRLLAGLPLNSTFFIILLIGSGLFVVLLLIGFAILVRLCKSQSLDQAELIYHINQRSIDGRPVVRSDQLREPSIISQSSQDARGLRSDSLPTLQDLPPPPPLLQHQQSFRSFGHSRSKTNESYSTEQGLAQGHAIDSNSCQEISTVPTTRKDNERLRCYDNFSFDPPSSKVSKF